MTETYEINTKGICLFCYQYCSTFELKTVERHFEDKTAIKMLMRYLKINILQLAPFSSSVTRRMGHGDILDLGVSMCDICTSVINQFSQLYNDFEKIRLRMDGCVRSLYDLMKIGDNDKIRVEEYGRRMTSWNPIELLNVSVAESLRNETMQKCGLRVGSCVPKVEIIKTTYQPVFNFVNYSAHPPPPPLPPRRFLGPKSAPPTPPILPPRRFLGPKSIRAKLECQNTESPRIKRETRHFDKSNLTFSSTSMECEDNKEMKVLDSMKVPNIPTIKRKYVRRKPYKNKKFGMKRLKRIAYNQGTFPCNLCGRIFTAQCSLSRHKGTIHANATKKITSTEDKSRKRDFACDYCGQCFSTEAGCRVHSTNSHAMQVYAKDVPPGTSEPQLEAAIQCEVDKKRVLSKGEKASAPNNRFGCNRCDLRFQNCYSLRVHLLRRHLKAILENLPKVKDVVEDEQRHQQQAENSVEEEEMEEDVEEEEEEEDQPPFIVSSVSSYAEGEAANDSEPIVVDQDPDQDQMPLLVKVKDEPMY